MPRFFSHGKSRTLWQAEITRFFSTVSVFLILVVLSASTAVFCAKRGYTLYYGDAEAHLNIARRVLDSRTPGPEQLGTVWLPLPHLLMIPFAGRDEWWQSGIAGAIPSAACFVIAGMFLYAAALRVFSSVGPAFATALLFALNPNMLYLQSVPMTESIFTATLAALLWSTVQFRYSQSVLATIFAGVAACAASLTRYEGWFLIPFVSIYFLLSASRKWHAVVFLGIASLGPLSWLAHNQYYYSNALEFYNGEFSAKAIYARSLASGGARYPGDHDWRAAVEYYFAAVKLVIGRPLILLALGGSGVCIWQSLARRSAATGPGAGTESSPRHAARPAALMWPLVLLSLPPAFYIWSIHSGSTPIFVPTLWPHSWYNTRYALAALPFASFAAGALIAAICSLIPGRGMIPCAMAVPALVTFGWLLPSSSAISICWKESEINSAARRQWTTQAAAYFSVHREPDSSILMAFGGDLPGVLRAAGIPIRYALHDGNHPAWDATIARPELFLREKWVVAAEGDSVFAAIMRAQRFGLHYQLVKQIIVEGAPVIDIFERQSLLDQSLEHRF